MREAEDRFVAIGQEFLHSFELVMTIRDELRALRRKRSTDDTKQVKRLMKHLRHVFAWQDKQYDELVIIREQLSE